MCTSWCGGEVCACVHSWNLRVHVRTHEKKANRIPSWECHTSSCRKSLFVAAVACPLQNVASIVMLQNTILNIRLSSIAYQPTCCYATTRITCAQLCTPHTFLGPPPRSPTRLPPTPRYASAHYSGLRDSNCQGNCIAISKVLRFVIFVLWLGV